MIAVALDIQTNRIPNVFIIISLIAGLSYQIHFLGFQAIPISILGTLFPIILLFPIFIARGLGAGDLKLFAVVGVFLSVMQYKKIVFIIFVSMGVGAIQAIILICVKRKYQPTIHFSIPILISTMLSLGGAY